MIVIIIIIVIIILIILSGNVTYLFVKSSEGLRVFSSTDASLNLLRRFRFRYRVALSSEHVQFVRGKVMNYRNSNLPTSKQ